MRRGQFMWLAILVVLCLVVWSAFFVLRGSSPTEIAALPTRVLLPTETFTPSVTATSAPTSTSTATNTPLASATATATSTPTQTITPTLEARLIELVVVMPGVAVSPTHTPAPAGTILPAPPNPIEPLPDATDEAPPYRGWYSFESDHPLVQYSAPWQPRQIAEASRGQYRRTEDRSSYATFAFEGEGLRIRYVAARNMGMFDVVVDGQIVGIIDAYSPELTFIGTRVFFVGVGTHTLTIRSSGRKNEQSEGYVVGLDAIQVYRSAENTVILPQVAETEEPTPIAQDAISIELVSAPARGEPTSTPLAPAEQSVSVVIAYDENGNREVDPAEGVAGISVRAVDVENNRVIAQALTDPSGYALLNYVTDADTRIVVPYFGQVWEVPRGRSSVPNSFALLLEPGNQPGLIP